MKKGEHLPNRQELFRQKQARRSLWMLVSVMVVLVSMVCLTAVLLDDRPVKDERSLDIKPKSPQEHSREIAELASRLVKTNVCRNITPVHIYREEADGRRFLHATGGRHEVDGKIFTSGHVFWEIPHGSGRRILPWRYYYQVLQPYSTNLFPINRLELIPKVEANTLGASKDAVKCVPGESRIIAPLPPPPEGTLGAKLYFKQFGAYDQKVVARSTVTGEEVRVLGVCELKIGVFYFLLDYEAFTSQSGTLFASADDKSVYVLSRAIALSDKSRKIFRLDNSHKILSLCSALDLGGTQKTPKPK